jgi:hypothetical protein
MINDNDKQIGSPSGGWGSYGLPGPATTALRSKIIPLIEHYCSENGLIYGHDVDFGAGAQCFVIEANISITEKQRNDLKQIVMANSPTDHACYLEDY